MSELKSKDKESSPSSIGVESSLISTEVYYTTTIDPNQPHANVLTLSMHKKDVSGK